MSTTASFPDSLPAAPVTASAPPHDAARTLTDARFSEAVSDELIAFQEAPHLEREKRQFDEYLKVDMAHTVMLAEQHILDATQASLILNALREVQGLGVAGFPFDARKGSFLLQIEDYLFSRIGENVGGRMHTGRSRLDQGPTVRRLYKRRQLVEVMHGLLAMQATLIDLSRQHESTLMPGYTCMQHAHPGVFGHYLLSFATKLADDFDRLSSAMTRLNISPLGAAGLSGTSWPINRQRTAQLLGFDGLVDNAKLAREAFYAAEIAAGLSFVMATLNDLATDLHIWSTHEFGFIETGDEFCGTSSIFPQKKNPSGLEAVRFAAGGAVTWLATLLATFRAEGTGDVVMREAPLLDEAFVATRGSLRLLDAIVQTMQVRAGRMGAAVRGNWSTATSLADLMVQACDVSFRQAHSAVARLVRNALAQGLSEDAVDSAMLAQAASEIGVEGVAIDTAEIRRVLDVGEFARTRDSHGGISVGEIERLARQAGKRLAKAEAWMNEKRRQFSAADQMLQAAVQQHGPASAEV